jgi:hypothetical protein
MASNYSRVSAFNNYSFTDDGTIDGYRGKKSDITIPAKIHGIGIGNIEKNAFKNKGLTSVTFRSDINIGDSAFADNRITSVTLPNSGNIGSNAFANNRITSVTLPNSGNIGSNAFANNLITSVTLPNSGNVGSNAFANNRITSVTLPNSVNIGSNAFANNRITSVTLPYNAKIGSNAFTGNPITTVTMDRNVSYVAPNSFSGDIRSAVIGTIVETGNSSGTYTYQDNQWMVNGKAPRTDFVTLNQGDGIRILRIDEDSPNGHHFDDRWYINPGMHTVEVTYYKETYGYVIRSEDSVTFEHRYFFENGSYTFTGTEEGDQIIFRVERR